MNESVRGRVVYRSEIGVKEGDKLSYKSEKMK